MIKNKKMMFLVISIFTLVLFLGGTAYAWFSYRSESRDQELIAGDIYLTVTEGEEEITLTNIFPETKEEARSRNDNYMTFEVSGINTSNKTLYYEFILNHGADKASPKTRYNDADLRFDLVQLDANDDEVGYLLNNVSYDTLVNKRIYVDTVDANTTVSLTRKYKLRMWLSEGVIISDTVANANYTTAEYKNKYATIKLTVAGDFQEKYFGYQKVLKAIESKQNATTNSCNPVWIDDNGTASDESDDITYFSGNNTCVDMNYVWYSGKLWRITAIYPDGAMKLVTENNITSIAFNASGQVNFYTDANTTSYMYQWLNEDFYDTLYNANQFIDTSKQWNATMPANTTISTKPLEINMVTANVGLLNNYEYYNSYRCIGSSTCTGSSYSTGYLNIGYYWWLLNPYNALGVWHVYNGGSGGSNLPSNTNGARPSIYLKSGLEFTGDGSKQSPYKIVGDKDTGAANELVNTRISGEYVKLKNGNNEQLFRIIGVEDNKTKIIAMDYADNKATKKFAVGNTSGDGTIYGTGQTATQGEDTWYNYLTGTYEPNLETTYGPLFDSSTYYMGEVGEGQSYKLGICSTSTGLTKTCTKTNQVGTFNIGLPRYGEMFATQQSGGDSNSTAMWLINRYSTSRVWDVSDNGYGDYYNPANALGARPTVHLKSSVKIISGTGTETDPYVVGL